MTNANKSQPSTDDLAPFGTTPRRSNAPLILIGMLYAAWFIVLCWMAAYHIGH